MMLKRPAPKRLQALIRYNLFAKIDISDAPCYSNVAEVQGHGQVLCIL